MIRKFALWMLFNVVGTFLILVALVNLGSTAAGVVAAVAVLLAVLSAPLLWRLPERDTPSRFDKTPDETDGVGRLIEEQNEAGAERNQIR